MRVWRVNYKNVVKVITQDAHFLELFFRNLLMGESNELKNRYLIINPPEECEQVQDKFQTDNPNILKLVQVVGYNELSVKRMMEGFGLKGRDNFLNLYLTLAIAAGYILLLYPNSPRHPRQKYLLTVKGLTLYNEISNNLLFHLR